MRGSTGFFWVTNSSLDWQTANNRTSLSGSSVGSNINSVPFLTNSPSPKHTTRSSKELLYFLLPHDLSFHSKGLDNLKYFADVTYWDGSTQYNVPLSSDALILDTGNTGNAGRCFTSNISYSSIGLQEVEEASGKRIKWVDFTLKGLLPSTTNYASYSRTKRYVFPFEEPSNQFGVAFQNAVGCYDTYHFTGLKEETVERDFRDLTYAVRPEENGSYGAGFKKDALADVRLTKKIVVNSGWISESTFNWLKEMIGSSNVYSYTDQYENFLKLIDHKYNKNNQTNEYNLECSFLQTIYDNHVSV